MTGLVGAGLGLLGSFGVVLVVAAFAGYGLPERTRSSGSGVWRREVDWRFVVGGAVGGLVLWWLSGLVALGLLVLGGLVAAPLFARARRERELLVARTEALATWAESLRDFVRSHAGLRQAVVASLGSVDAVIEAEVVALASELEAESSDVALARFADRVADPVGDLLATALTVALGESGARDIPALLGRLASDARDEVSGIRRAAVAHERSFGTARAMAIVVLVTALGMFAVSGEYVAQYRTGEGQVVLVGVVLVALVALWGLVRMARPARPVRVLVATGVVR